MPAKRQDLTGKIFGELTVLAFLYTEYPNYTSIWECICTCGRRIKCRTHNLNSGNSTRCKSCAATTHGLTGTREYRAWDNMIQRCNTFEGYSDIAVYPAWALNFTEFYTYLTSPGGPGLHPGPGYSLDRINNHGHYWPGNIRWATAAEQAQNRG